MGIDDFSEAIGELRTDVRHILSTMEEEGKRSSKARQATRESLAEIKESQIRGDGRMSAIETRLDDMEPALNDHITNCQIKQERKIGADLYRKGVWGLIGTATGAALMWLGNFVINAVKAGLVMIAAH